MHTCSVHSCGFVQDVHRHGSVTGEANGTCSALKVTDHRLEVYSPVQTREISAAASHSHSQQRTTNTSQTHPPICHCFGPTLGLIITHFISSSSAPSPLDPGGPG